MSKEIAIRIAGVKKKYRLGQIGGGTLQGDLQSWWARLNGREDPNAVIGTNRRLRGKTFMALDGIDLTVYKGETLGIIGSNGAGKSTLLKLLSRVTAPSEGEIDLYGRIASMLEVGTGFNPEMTGRENIYMNGAILGMTRAETDAKMEDIIEFSEVREFIDTPVKRYSSGMYVKLAFSVAAHLDSEIIIMDEVLAVGDMAFQKKCLDKMREAVEQEGRTVLCVSHNMNIIRQLCDRCIVLEQGKIIYDGDVTEAIGLYMSKSKTWSVHNVCTDQQRAGHPHTDGRIHMEEVTVLDKTFPSFLPGEPVRISVRYHSGEEIPDMAFRMTVQTLEKMPVGMATTSGSIQTHPGENRVTLTLRHDWLAPGKYCVKLTAYSVRGAAARQMHDVVDDAFFFRKLQDHREINQMAWDAVWWGRMKFPEIEAEQETE